MQVTCIQMESTPFDRDANLAFARHEVEEAARAGASLIVLPEYFATGCAYDRRLRECAESMEDHTVGWMLSAARSTRTWVGGGIVERGRRRVHNTFVLAAPDGRTWTYRKRCLPLFERLYFTTGREVGILETPLGRIGVMLCWDMIHGRLARELSGRIDLLIISSAWPDVASGSTRHPWIAGPLNRLCGRPGLLDCPTTLSLPGLSGWLSRPPIRRPRELAALLNVPVVHCNMAGPFQTRVPGTFGLEFDARYAGSSAILDATGAGPVGPIANPFTLHGDVPMPGEHRTVAA